MVTDKIGDVINHGISDDSKRWYMVDYNTKTLYVHASGRAQARNAARDYISKILIPDSNEPKSMSPKDWVGALQESQKNVKV